MAVERLFLFELDVHIVQAGTSQQEFAMRFVHAKAPGVRGN
jgi:hypothetical protein